MATVTVPVTKNSKSFSGGVTGTAGRGKKVVVQVGGTPEVGDKFNILLGTRNFGFVGKPVGNVVALATLKDKVYAIADTILYFCAIAKPTKWQPDVDIGAGFINMASSYFGAEKLTALGVYQNNLAVFSRWSTYIWYVDPDPVGNRLLQVLDNIGCLAPKSVVSVGDLDVFFLSDTGLRSLRARDSSNAAFISDVGTPIDPMVIQTLRGLTDAEKTAAVGVIEPEDGRYILQVGGVTFVFSFFQGAKISAWSTYQSPSPMTYLVVLNGRVYGRRADNSLFLYGGSNNATWDGSQVEVETPFLDARAPATWKMLEGVDMGIEGEWIIDVCPDPTNPTVFERIGQVALPTYTMMRIPLTANSTHFKLRLRSVGNGYARLSNIAVHYQSNETG